MSDRDIKARLDHLLTASAEITSKKHKGWLRDAIEIAKAETARAEAYRDTIKKHEKCFVRISESFGITSPLILISMAENDEENYAEILARYVEKQMKAPEDKP